MQYRVAIIGSRPPKKPWTAAEYEEFWGAGGLLALLREWWFKFIENHSRLDATIVSGGAKGIDQEAAKLARAAGFQVREYLPQYRYYSATYAPIARNGIILENCDILHAFPSSWSSGSLNAITRAMADRKLGDVIRYQRSSRS